MTPRVVLVGAPGAGKTTVGLLLAQSLGVGFRDTDRDVEAAAGKSVAEVFFDDGEQAFRTAEAQAVSAALAGHDGVLALGGGAVLDPATRTALGGHCVVALAVSAADAAARVGFARDRPVLGLNPRATLRHLLEQRAPWYAEVSCHVVETGHRSPAQVAQAVLAVLAP